MPLTAACCGECNDPMRPATMLGLAVRGCAIKRHLSRGGVGGLRGGRRWMSAGQEERF